MLYRFIPIKHYSSTCTYNIICCTAQRKLVADSSPTSDELSRYPSQTRGNPLRRADTWKAKELIKTYTYIPVMYKCVYDNRRAHIILYIQSRNKTVYVICKYKSDRSRRRDECKHIGIHTWWRRRRWCMHIRYNIYNNMRVCGHPMETSLCQFGVGSTYIYIYI